MPMPSLLAMMSTLLLLAMLGKMAAMKQMFPAMRLQALRLRSKEVALLQENLFGHRAIVELQEPILATRQKMKRPCPCHRSPLPILKHLRLCPCRLCPCLCRSCHACLHL